VQVVGNICLKINAKLGGVNHTLADNSKPTCLQVYHTNSTLVMIKTRRDHASSEAGKVREFIKSSVRV
jgi:hypothetical protein